MSLNRRKDKENVLHLHNGVFITQLLKKKKQQQQIMSLESACVQIATWPLDNIVTSSWSFDIRFPPVNA